jgi:hypothetical protein
MLIPSLTMTLTASTGGFFGKTLNVQEKGGKTAKFPARSVVLGNCTRTAPRYNVSCPLVTHSYPQVASAKVLSSTVTVDVSLANWLADSCRKIPIALINP